MEPVLGKELLFIHIIYYPQGIFCYSCQQVLNHTSICPFSLFQVHANAQILRHAPMVAIGKTPIDFVVVQFENRVGIEDCQEVEIRKGRTGQLMVAVPESGQNRGLWRL